MNKKPTAEELKKAKDLLEDIEDNIATCNDCGMSFFDCDRYNIDLITSYANNAVEEKDKRIAELEQGIKKFIHHWRKYFDSPKVGQPPVLSDLEFILTNKD